MIAIRCEIVPTPFAPGSVLQLDLPQLGPGPAWGYPDMEDAGVGRHQHSVNRLVWSLRGEDPGPYGIKTTPDYRVQVHIIHLVNNTAIVMFTIYTLV